MLDWNAICLIEPRLLDLARQAAELGPDDRYVNYEMVKREMSDLVGWNAGKDELRSEHAWSVALENTAMKCAP